MNTLKEFLVYKKASTLYEFPYKDCMAYFETTSPGDTLALVDKDWQPVFHAIDGAKNIKAITREFKEHFPPEDIIDFFAYLIRKKIIYTFNFKEAPINQKKIKQDFFRIGLSLTDSCNLSCGYCIANLQGDSLSKDDGIAYLETVFKMVKAQKKKEILVDFTAGEALLRFEQMLFFKQYIDKRAEELNLIPTYYFTTNGTLLTREKLEKLVEAGLVNCGLSFDGLGESCDSRKYANGKPAFEKILSAFYLLKEYNMKFGIGITITPSSAQGLPAFIKFLNENDTFYSCNFLAQSEYNKDKEDSSYDDESQLIESMQNLYKYILEHLNEYDNLQYALLDHIDLKEKKFYRCGIETGHGIQISPKGFVNDCPYKESYWGHANDKNISEQVFNTADIININVDDKEDCATCTWKYVCRGGCPAHNMSAYNNPYRKAPHCNVYKALIPELLKLHAEKELVTVYGSDRAFGWAAEERDSGLDLVCSNK